jgi:hypothetical protein
MSIAELLLKAGHEQGAQTELLDPAARNKENRRYAVAPSSRALDQHRTVLARPIERLQGRSSRRVTLQVGL